MGDVGDGAFADTAREAARFGSVGRVLVREVMLPGAVKVGVQDVAERFTVGDAKALLGTAAGETIHRMHDERG